MLYKFKQRWDWDNILLDRDGSFGGKSGDVVIFKNDFSMNDSRCRPEDSNAFIGGIICSDTTSWTKLSFFGMSSAIQSVFVTNKNNQEIESPRLPDRLKYRQSMMFAAESNNTYTIRFKNLDTPSSMSYYITCENFKEYEYVIIRQELLIEPTTVYVNGYRTASNTSLTPASKNLDWYFDTSTNVFEYIVKCYVSPYVQDRQFYVLYRYVAPTSPITTVKTTTKSTGPTGPPGPTVSTTRRPTTTTLADVYKECPKRVVSRPEWNGNTTAYWYELDFWHELNSSNDTSHVNSK